jgi:hypothetical protein
MNLLAELQKDHSKEITDKIVEYVSGDDERLAELMDIFFNSSWEIVQRAAWAVGKLGEKTDLLIPYLKPMINNLKKPKLHDAIKRNTVRTWQFMTIPDDYLGEVAELCFDFLASKDEAIAIKVFSMVVLEGIVMRVPELKTELQFLIEEQLPYGSAGFKNRGQKVLRNIKDL